MRIPAALRTFSQGSRSIEISCEQESVKLADCLDLLESFAPGIGSTLREQSGEVRGFIGIYVDGEDSRHLDGLGTRVGRDAEILILNAVAGG